MQVNEYRIMFFTVSWRWCTSFSTTWKEMRQKIWRVRWSPKSDKTNLIHFTLHFIHKTISNIIFSSVCHSPCIFAIWHFDMMFWFLENKECLDWSLIITFYCIVEYKVLSNLNIMTLNLDISLYFNCFTFWNRVISKMG